MSPSKQKTGAEEEVSVIQIWGLNTHRCCLEDGRTTWELRAASESWEAAKWGPRPPSNWILPATWMSMEADSFPEPPDKILAADTLTSTLGYPEQRTQPHCASLLTHRTVIKWVRLFKATKFVVICYYCSNRELLQWVIYSLREGVLAQGTTR